MTKRSLLPSKADRKHNPHAADGFSVSTFSFTKAPSCVAVRVDETIGVRDTKNPQSPTLIFNKKEWAAFIKGVKAGEFDI